MKLYHSQAIFKLARIDYYKKSLLRFFFTHLFSKKKEKGLDLWILNIICGVRSFFDARLYYVI